MPRESGLGRVQLVGAGPGPADLLTLRALRAIEAAQAVLYDALISPEVVALAPANCLRIQTGKRAGRASMAQATINRLMLRLARRGLSVVRLKGGDPSIFGRLGEELAFLRSHGVPSEVVPGVTAACAAAGQFGFPLTERGCAQRVVFATARLATGARADDWAVVADAGTTAVIYMGRDAAADIAAGFIAAGRCPETPAAMIENAGVPDAKVLFAGPLQALGQRAPSCAEGPAVIVVGAVARRLATATGHGLKTASGRPVR